MDDPSIFRVADGTNAPLSPSLSPHASMLVQDTEETMMLSHRAEARRMERESAEPLHLYEEGNQHHSQHHRSQNHQTEHSFMAEGHAMMPSPPQQQRLQEVGTLSTQIAPRGPPHFMLPSTMVEPEKRRRLCKFPNCDRVVKSQGHCQRHGAKPKRCKVANCDKQAQGTHDGMCKRHWRESTMPAVEIRTKPVPPDPVGISVYDAILPQSMAYKPPVTAIANLPPDGPIPEGAIMPLVEHLRQGRLTKEFGWHRKAERQARGVFAVTSLTAQFEAWERQLVRYLFVSNFLMTHNDSSRLWSKFCC